MNDDDYKSRVRERRETTYEYSGEGISVTSLEAEIMADAQIKVLKKQDDPRYVGEGLSVETLEKPAVVVRSIEDLAGQTGVTFGGLMVDADASISDLAVAAMQRFLATGDPRHLEDLNLSDAELDREIARLDEEDAVLREQLQADDDELTEAEVAALEHGVLSDDDDDRVIELLRDGGVDDPSLLKRPKMPEPMTEDEIAAAAITGHDVIAAELVIGRLKDGS